MEIIAGSQAPAWEPFSWSLGASQIFHGNRFHQGPWLGGSVRTPTYSLYPQRSERSAVPAPHGAGDVGEDDIDAVRSNAEFHQ